MKTQLVRLSERLVANALALSEGRLSAADDLSGILRTLVAHGRGDDAVHRAIRRFHLREPTVQVSTPVARKQRILLAFGGVPNRAPAEPTESVAYSIWADSLALANAGLRRDYYTWAQFITEYANTYGSHMSGTVPDVLSEATIHRVNDRVDLGTYLIWSAAVVASECLSDVLHQLELPDAGPPIEPGFYVTRFECTTFPNGEMAETSCNIMPETTGTVLEFRGVLMGGHRRLWKLSSAVGDDGTASITFDAEELA